MLTGVAAEKEVLLSLVDCCEDFGEIACKERAWWSWREWESTLSPAELRVDEGNEQGQEQEDKEYLDIFGNVETFFVLPGNHGSLSEVIFRERIRIRKSVMLD